MATTANRTIVDYSLIESDDHAELVEAVVTAFTDGWQPLGGVCVWYEPPAPAHSTAHSGGGASYPARSDVVHYVQALVKYAE